MRVIQCRELEPRWDEFVRSSPQGTFFHLLDWRGILERNFGYEPLYLYAEDQGKIHGLLPLFFVKSFLFGKSLITIPLGVYGGVIADNDEASKLLSEKAREMARDLKVKYLEIRGNPYDQAPSLFIESNDPRFKQKDLYVTFIREIESDEEKNFARIPRKQRRMIRQAQKFGLRSFIDDDRLRDFYLIYAASVKNLGTPVYDFDYFQDLKETFKDACKILIVEKEGRTIAGVMSFFFREQVLPYYGGSLPEMRPFAPNDFMYWELLSYAGKNGYRIFDFGRSKKGTGSYHFKRHWGFEPQELPYLYYQTNGNALPDTSSLNPKLQWAIGIWKVLPFKLTLSLGPHIARHLP